MPYDRYLGSDKAAEHFLTGCLKIGVFHDKDGNPIDIGKIIKRIRDAETLVEKGSRENTRDSEDQRARGFRTKIERQHLRDSIVEELFGLDRIDDDDSIKSGVGGAKPKTAPAKNKEAYLVTGLPASGKSTVISRISDRFGAYVIDPDYAKRKLPEYDNTVMGAALVHAESSAITFGKDYAGPNLLQTCMYAGFNIVRPLVGERRQKVDDFRSFLQKEGYKVHLCVVDLDREEAVKRALGRFINTDRYVSLGYVFDDCANDPSLVYYKYRAEACDKKFSPWESLGAVSTAGSVPTRIDSWGNGNPAELFT